MSHDLHATIQDLLPGYAVGALEPDEVALVEGHLDSCDECARVADELLEGSEVLAGALPPMAPPPHLKARVMEAIGRPRPLPAPPRAAAWPRYALAAAGILLVVLGVLTMQLRSEVRGLQARLEQEAEGRKAARREGREEGRREVLEVLSARQPVQVTLSGERAGRIRIYYDESTGRAVVVTRSLPALPAGQVYQLWLIRPEGPQSAGTVQTDGVATLSQDVRGTDTVAVTVEPGEKPAPTGQPVWSSKI